MAETIHSELAQFQDQLQVEFFEKSAQASDFFNANSNGTINITDKAVLGTFPEKGFFQNRNTVARRDTDATGDRTLVGHVQDTRKGVVVDRIVSDDVQISALKKQGIDPGQYGRDVGAAVAKDQMDDMLATALSGLVGGIDKAAATKNNQAANFITSAFIQDTKALFGDRRNRLAGVFMNSSPFNVLMKELSGSPNLVTDLGAGVLRSDVLMIYLGVPIFVTDDASLVISGAPDTYRTLILVQNALKIDRDETLPLRAFEQLDKKNAVTSITSEYNLGIDQKGFSYTNATKNPLKSALATTANWTQKAASVKDVSGVELITK